MHLTISDAVFATFSPATQAEIIARYAGEGMAPVTPTASPGVGGADYEGVDMDDVADITPKQMREWMTKASDKTKAGLRLFAERPVVSAKELRAAGIDNIAHFQSRTTIRTRTVTGDKDAFLLGWDDWQAVAEGEGRYAVTPITHQALRAFFKLD